ncbi:MAG: M20/M25/M40 family metallo-hydrolase [Planctomycetota bacterium]|nr:M20/M25/M40 family metallo-hydrolase [Planctomycetota bacterium]
MDELTRALVEWIEIPSVSGEETDYGDALARALAAKGFATERQEVAPGRANVLARAGEPEVVFCTHLDTVPPFYGSKVDSDFVHGRGSCDAKGQAVAMLAAAEALLAQGEDRIGFLFTVGEETDSCGAQHANRQRTSPWNPRYTIIGEPTGGRFVSGHKGIYKARLVGHGVAGHSSQAVGPSAIHELVGCCSRLLDQRWGQHAFMGAGTLNIGGIGGGIASNVVADHAEADVMLRIVEEPALVEARIQSCLGEHVTLEAAFKSFGPVEFHVPAGEDSFPVAFGTDAPHLPDWGTPLLFGAGDILDAHTDHEKVGRKDLERCAARHVRTVTELLARVEA